MYTADVFPGTAPRSDTVPQMPTNPPLGQVVGAGVGWSPSLHASAATTASAARKTALGMPAMIGAGAGGVNLTAVSAGNNVKSAMPIYEYRCTKCEARFSQHEEIEQHGRTSPACPQCGSHAVEQVLSPFFAKTVRKS